MKQNLLLPLSGAVAIGIFIGACARQVSTDGSSTRSDVQAPAIAQDISAQNGNSIRNSGDMARLSATYAALARKVTPAVVNINTRQVVRGRVLDDPFGGFFGERGGTTREPDREAQGTGSGVIVDARGVIITNNHVVEGATTVTVTLNDRRKYEAKVVGTDPDSDLAVLKIEAQQPLPTVRWADSDRAQVGDIVLAVGSPFGLSATVTQGIISAKDRRDLDLSRIEDFLQTDAAINPGNSGGALVDINGDLVGINTAILSRSGGNQGIGLAIPAKLARNISGQLLASGRVTRGYLGIQAENVDERVARQIGFSGSGGLLVTGVASSGPAGSLPWIREGANVITRVDGKELDGIGQFRNLITEKPPGTVMKLEVWQKAAGGEGQTRTFEVRTARAPALNARP